MCEVLFRHTQPTDRPAFIRYRATQSPPTPPRSTNRACAAAQAEVADVVEEPAEQVERVATQSLGVTLGRRGWRWLVAGGW